MFITVAFNFRLFPSEIRVKQILHISISSLENNFLSGIGRNHLGMTGALHCIKLLALFRFLQPSLFSSLSCAFWFLLFKFNSLGAEREGPRLGNILIRDPFWVGTSFRRNVKRLFCPFMVLSWPFPHPQHCLLRNATTDWLRVSFWCAYNENRIVLFEAMMVLIRLITLYGCVVLSFPHHLFLSLLSPYTVCSELLSAFTKQWFLKTLLWTTWWSHRGHVY